MRAAGSASRTSTVVTARRDTGHHEVWFPESVIFGDVSKSARLADLSGLHERAGIRGTGVRTPTPWTSILRVARRKPKKGYQATTRPSQETGPALPGWPSLVIRSEKKTGEEPRRFSKQVRGYLTRLGSSRMWLEWRRSAYPSVTGSSPSVEQPRIKWNRWIFVRTCETCETRARVRVCVYISVASCWLSLSDFGKTLTRESWKKIVSTFPVHLLHTHIHARMHAHTHTHTHTRAIVIVIEKIIRRGIRKKKWE